MNKITQTKKNLLGIAAAAILLPQTHANAAPEVSVEGFIADKYATTDTKVFSPIGERNSIFARNISTFDKQTGNISPFSYIDLNQSIPKVQGLDLTYETTFLDTGQGIDIIPGIGFTYSRELLNTNKNNLSLLVVPIINLRNPESITLQANLNYSRELSKNLKAFLDLETVTGFSTRNTYDFLSIKPRLGLEYKGKYAIGVGADINVTPSGNGNSTDHNLGVFGRVKF